MESELISIPCDNCGVHLKYEFKFCPSCGTERSIIPEGRAESRDQGVAKVALNERKKITIERKMAAGVIAKGIEIVTGLTTLGTAVKTAAEMVKEGLHNVKVCETDAQAIRKKLEDCKFEKWNEKVELMHAEKIKMTDIGKFMDNLEESYKGIDKDLRKKMNGIKWAEEWDHKIVEFKYNKKDGGGDEYGMVAFGKSEDGKTVDCMYVCYFMDFKMADIQLMKIQHSLIWGLCTWTTTNREHVDTALSTHDINRIKNFLRIQALQGFFKEGVIDKINYVKDMDAITS